MSQEKKSELEVALEQLNQNFKCFMTKTETIFKSREASLRNLEVQVGQIANLFSSNTEQDHEQEKEEIILGQPQEFFEEAKAHKDEESNIKEDFDWFSNYEKSISVQKIKEIKTTEQKR